MRSPDVGIVSLTGDVNTGKIINTNSSDTLKRIHLELGGKAPVVVFDDADLESVVEWVSAAGYFNAGQDCTAACRVLVADRRLRQRCSATSCPPWRTSRSAARSRTTSRSAR